MSGSRRASRVDLSSLDLSTADVAALLDTDEEAVGVADAQIALVRECAASITSMRQIRDLRSADLAALLGMSPGRMSQLESGELRHAASLKTLAEIAHKLGFEVSLDIRPKQAAGEAASGVKDIPGTWQEGKAAGALLHGLTVTAVTHMAPLAIGAVVKRLADEITRRHPEAAGNAFVEEAAALSEEEEDRRAEEA
jgi:transcriptional regulator with XRE-family HTH domain